MAIIVMMNMMITVMMMILVGFERKKLTMIRYADCIFLWYFCTDHVAPGNFCQY